MVSAVLTIGNHRIVLIQWWILVSSSYKVLFQDGTFELVEKMLTEPSLIESSVLFNAVFSKGSPVAYLGIWNFRSFNVHWSSYLVKIFFQWTSNMVVIYFFIAANIDCCSIAFVNVIFISYAWGPAFSECPSTHCELLYEILKELSWCIVKFIDHSYMIVLFWGLFFPYL